MHDLFNIISIIEQYTYTINELLNLLHFCISCIINMLKKALTRKMVKYLTIFRKYI